MKQLFSPRRIMALAATAGVLAIVACAPAKQAVVVAPPPPPPPPAPAAIPPRPTPPNNAPPNLVPPPIEANGLFRSVNRGISVAQTTWNLRSAYNVAALNCSQPQHAEIVVNYRAFLRAHSSALAAVNRKVDAEFRDRYGARFIASRERYMTEVYNHYALPPTLTDFCDAALAVSRDAIPVRSADLDAFTARSLPNIEIVFDDFYRRYLAYRTALAQWDARYGTPVSGQGLAQEAGCRVCREIKAFMPDASSLRGPLARAAAAFGSRPQLALERGRSSAGRARRSQ